MVDDVPIILKEGPKQTVEGFVLSTGKPYPPARALVDGIEVQKEDVVLPVQNSTTTKRSDDHKFIVSKQQRDKALNYTLSLAASIVILWLISPRGLWFVAGIVCVAVISLTGYEAGKKGYGPEEKMFRRR